MSEVVILGSGIAGISAGYHLRLQGVENTIYEQEADWGGLCGQFSIDGFRFDRFVHFTFAEDAYVQRKFLESGDLHEHVPFPSNYYRGYWLTHPAQNNLAPLPIEAKVKIIADFINRPTKAVHEVRDYEEWLRVQYGGYFSENFPFAYTRKYWGVEPRELETKWVGQRMYVSHLEEVLRGAFEEQSECFYYTKVMKYPKKGGFRSILNACREGLDIQFCKKAISIDVVGKRVGFNDGSTVPYQRLVSTLPLPEIVHMIAESPTEVLRAADHLQWTCGYQISLGFNRPDVAKHLWFYIYDEDILSARVYSPNLKSTDNVPLGCSSLQAEVFYAHGADRHSEQHIMGNTLQKLLSMGLFKEEDIVVKDIRFEKYANIIFGHDIYENRQIVLDYLTSLGIQSIGRFGQWDYLWSHQAFASGMNL